jgi:hypothetical protein
MLLEKPGTTPHLLDQHTVLSVQTGSGCPYNDQKTRYDLAHTLKSGLEIQKERRCHYRLTYKQQLSANPWQHMHSKATLAVCNSEPLQKCDSSDLRNSAKNVSRRVLYLLSR